MNNIFLSNMQAVMEIEKPQPKPIRTRRLHSDSKSKEIILFLLKNGKSSGSEIMKALELERSPKAYIQKHVKAKRVICEIVSSNRANYSIDKKLSAKDFGFNKVKEC